MEALARVKVHSPRTVPATWDSTCTQSLVHMLQRGRPIRTSVQCMDKQDMVRNGFHGCICKRKGCTCTRERHDTFLKFNFSRSGNVPQRSGDTFMTGPRTQTWQSWTLNLLFRFTWIFARKQMSWIIQLIVGFSEQLWACCFV